MRWNRSHESSNVDDRRAQGPAFGGGGGSILGLLPLLSRFGWKGILVGILIAGALYGRQMCTSVGPDSGRNAGSFQQNAGSDELARFVGFVLDDVQETWQKKLPGYRPAKLVLFRGAVDSACGTASSAVGPFYCPNDQQVYVDLAFYQELNSRFGAPGDFAQAYVIAHEIGHHLQNLQGNLFGSREGKESIATELQADCLAGVWAADAERRGLLETGDVGEALDAAAAVGDDALQKQSSGRVQPETWTHGSSQQRLKAFQRGFEGGALSACN